MQKSSELQGKTSVFPLLQIMLESYQFLRYGPICVDISFRQQHVAKGMYEFVRAHYPCHLLVVMVRELNIASQLAHEAMGFTELHSEVEGGVLRRYLARQP